MAYFIFTFDENTRIHTGTSDIKAGDGPELINLDTNSYSQSQGDYGTTV